MFTLPSQMRAPAPVVNDFEDRNVSDFTFSGGQFALATRGSDDVLAQGATSGLAIATLNDTDWTDYQRVKPTSRLLRQRELGGPGGALCRRR